MKKILRVVIIVSMIMCLGAMPVMAGNSSYSTGEITNYAGLKAYHVMTASKNTKATTNANWFMKVTSITITGDTSKSLGMAFTPFKQTGRYDYGSAGANDIWAKASFSSVKYAGWTGNGTANINYYLGARLDTVLTSNKGVSSGYWNSN